MPGLHSISNCSKLTLLNLAERVKGGIEELSTEHFLHDVDSFNQAQETDHLLAPHPTPGAYETDHLRTPHPTHGDQPLPGDGLICLGCDTVSLYPSLRAEEIARVVAQELINSDLQFEGLS